MRLRFPPSLHYPITVTDLLKHPDQDVDISAPLFAYSYQTTVTEIDRSGDEHEVVKTFPSRFESSVDGILRQWFLREGALITHPGADIAEIEEPCAHSVQFGGMCVNCGKDMTEQDFATGQLNIQRAQINMIHDNNALRVSAEEATRVEEEAKHRLLEARKLSLVVDLDQTIIHATVDPTVGEWQQDTSNPNHRAVANVRSFQLVDEGPGGRGTWYYIKLRPGLAEFLERISQIYELHIYTMGTRAYAQHIAGLVDPDRRLFGDRILSRDESGSLVAKNLQRLFPVDTKMVVIIDDRGDVWNWNANFIRVSPYSFFTGIGDINSSFLPQKPRLKLTGPKAEPAPKAKAPSELADASQPPAVDSAAIESQLSGTTPADGQQDETDNKEALSRLEEFISMTYGGDTADDALREQTAKQDEALTAQQHDRPLLQKQKQLENATAAATTGNDEESDSDGERQPQHILHDQDDELSHLEDGLRTVHAAFFRAYDARSSSGSVSAKKGRDLNLVPDIKTIMPEVKTRVLSGIVIVFSGVIPLDTDPARAEIAIWARSFGARISQRVSGKRTTHVVAARPRTAKVRQAVRRGAGRIHVVGLRWLVDSMVRWQRQDEEPYRLSTDDASLGKPFPGEEEEDDQLSESEDPSSAPDTDVDLTENEGDPRRGNGVGSPQLSVKTQLRRGAPSENLDDEELEELAPDDLLEDDSSPVGGTDQDWKEINDELADFLGSDADDDDNDQSDDDQAEVIPGGNADRNDDSASETSRSSHPSVNEGARVASSTHQSSSQSARNLKRSRTDSGTNLSGSVSVHSIRDVTTDAAHLSVNGSDGDASRDKRRRMAGSSRLSQEVRAEDLPDRILDRAGTGNSIGGKGGSQDENGSGSHKHTEAEVGVGVEAEAEVDADTDEGDGWSEFEGDFEAELLRAGEEDKSSDRERGRDESDVADVDKP